MLRGLISPDLPQPMLGVNLRDPSHQLQPGEVLKLQNLLWDGTTRMIPGSSLLTPSTLDASFRIRGGHRFYPRGGSAKRLVAYGTRISIIDDAGAETILTSTASSDLDVYFTTWSIQNRVYATNGSDNLFFYDGSSSGLVTGTAIPSPKARIAPILDRLMAITADGIERTDARTDAVWSNNSTWATLRPLQPGEFTAIHPFVLKGTDTFYEGLLALQESAYYVITGTDFGTDVTAVTASTGEDSSIRLIDPDVGTASPKSVVSVPSVGTFFLTKDPNVFWIPEGEIAGRYVGDNLHSYTTTKGLNNINQDAIDQAWMTYFDRKLLLGFPTGTNTYPDTQYWLDMRDLRSLDNRRVAWYGPMNVDTWGVVWREDQGTEQALKAGEGNPSTGAFVYKAYQNTLAGHASGASTLFPTCIYQDRNQPFSTGKGSKYIPDIRFTIDTMGGSMIAGVGDLKQNVVFQQPLVEYSD